MAVSTVINGDLSILKGILENSGYFDTVTVESTGGVGLLTCIKGDLTFYLGDGFPGGGAYNGRWGIYVKSTVTESCWSAKDDYRYETFNYPEIAYVCSGGIAIKCRIGRIVITKTNNEKTVVLFPENHTPNGNDEELSDANNGSIAAIADGDADTFKFFMNNCNYYTAGRRYAQTYLIPVPTNASMGTVSYTPTVSLIFLPQTRDVCNFIYNNKRYFSDGYYAIEDQEVSS